MTIITRKAAKAAGLKRYFTGRPCKRGHIDERHVSSFGCMACARERERERFRNLTDDKRDARREYERTRWKDPGVRQWVNAYEAAHRAERLAYRKAYKDAHPEYFKQYYAARQEQRKHEARAWYQANAKWAAERQKAYVATHQEQTRATGRRSANKRRAVAKQAFVEVVDPIVVFARDQGICGICRQPVVFEGPWDVDHVIPITKGGPHAYTNVQLAHVRCNRSKGNRVPP